MSYLKDFMIEQIKDAAELYVKDLHALSEEQLAANPGGCSRPAFDYTYEIIELNNRFASRLSGAVVPAANRDGWVKAPDDFNHKETVIAHFEQSMANLLEVAANVDEDKITNTEGDSMGKMTPLEICTFIGVHTMYHCGQLNLLQTLGGDAGFHWM